jgi:tRNA pseudouridine65 synthase
VTQALAELARGQGWIVVAKPPRLLTHRTARTRGADAALQRVRDQVGASVYPIHRLDAPTSGCLLFATDRALAGLLSAALSAGQKTYLALVRGCCPPEARFEMAESLRDDNGILKTAQTALRCLGGDTERRCSLVIAQPTTGRYHQVRRHLRRLSHPVIGDRAHGDSHVNRAWRAEGIDRLALHCAHLSLSLPSGERLSVRCPLFSDQRAVYETLPMWPAALAALPGLDAPGLPLLPIPPEP